MTLTPIRLLLRFWLKKKAKYKMAQMEQMTQMAKIAKMAQNGLVSEIQWGMIASNQNY